MLELLVFMGVVAPGFSVANFAANGWSGGEHFGLPALSGIFAAIPFAIWFFLAIEGAAMAAEEARDPKRTHSEGLYQRYSDAGDPGHWRDAAGRRCG